MKVAQTKTVLGVILKSNWLGNVHQLISFFGGYAMLYRGSSRGLRLELYMAYSARLTCRTVFSCPSLCHWNYFWRMELEGTFLYCDLHVCPGRIFHVSFICR